MENDEDQARTDMADEDDDVKLPELICSKIARVYNFEGNLKQGCSSFYTLRRL